MLMAMATLTWRLLGAKIFKSHRLNQFHWEGILAQLSKFRGIHWMLQDFMALGEAEVDGEAGRDSTP